MWSPGIEHIDKTLELLVEQWRRAVKPNLKTSTQDGYEWAIAQLLGRFRNVPIGEIANKTYTSS